MNRKLCIDGAEMAVIATTRNGEMIAACWGQTSATARPLPTRDEIAMVIAARHWDRDSGDVEGWHDLTLNEREAVAENYLTWDSADAVLALLKGQDA